MDYECICNAGVIKTSTIPECSNEPVHPYGADGPFVGKIPVVIAEPIVQIDVESVIKLEEPALEIKRIKKNVFIDQCKLIDMGGHTGKLFLSGFVRKNIEYATVDCSNEKHSSISGNIKHTTVNIPFTCATKVEYVTPPKLDNFDHTKELSMLSDKKSGHDFCKQEIIGRNPCEQSFQHFESFNEPIFCELEDAKIFENDTHKDAEPFGCDFPSEHTFDKIVEKMVVLVKIKLLQKQQVNIPGHKALDWSDKAKK